MPDQMHQCMSRCLFPWATSAACVVVLLATAVGAAAAAETIRVDCAEVLGEIRPLHGVNGGPLVQGETTDLSRYWREAGIPITRLHDCEWPLPDVVDLHAVFPRPEADPQDPASYRFALTDEYLRAIIDSGATVVYRLGESIEHSRHKQYVHAPADYDRWAAACLGIIRHYNDGWADGFRYNIRYWEIWNEPENRPAMWSGSDEDYYRLYTTAARAIKSRYPELQVGGPAVGATGELDGQRWRPTEFLEGFLRWVGERNAPLDFFSWHTYTDDPYLYVRKARAIRQWLDDRGFAHTKIHLNEWNYLPRNDWTPMLLQGEPERRQAWFETIGGAEGAAFTACVLIHLQDAPVDVANYYSGDVNPFGLFNRYGVPRKTYYAMRAFGQLQQTPMRVRADGGAPGRTAVCAGVNADRNRVAVLVANLRHAEERITLQLVNPPWGGATGWTVRRLDARENLAAVAAGDSGAGAMHLECEIPAPGVLLVEFRPAASAARSRQ
ncbi:MAG: hypothetical protein JXB62_23005 [Pirellulales bacterium]|nr:hypothetical protein [Pirellulales bacterium]